MSYIDSPIASNLGQTNKVNISLALDSENSEVTKTLKQLGFKYYSPNEKYSSKCIGSMLFVPSPKRIQGSLNLSVVENKYLPSKHGLSDVIIHNKADVRSDIIAAVRSHLFDLIKNDLCRKKVMAGLTKAIRRISPNYNRSNLLSQAILKTVEAHTKVKTSKSPQDLKHQVAFYLSTFEAEALFDNYNEISIKLTGEYEGAQPIINAAILEEAVKSQEQVVDRFIATAPDYVVQLLNPRGIFLDRKSRLIKKSGKGYCQSGNEIIPIELRELSTEYAFPIHEHLHYIHAARGDLAFGLFLENDAVPFSIQAVSKIDRSYKEEALLLSGYNPKYCMEFSRLFSRPGSPMNTSSFIQSAAIDCLVKKYPQLQAIITSFMPAYASGKSMICAGLDECLLAKTLHHEFFYSDGLLVNRVPRKQRGNPMRRTKISLFPTLELICKIRQPHENFWKLPPDYMPFYFR